MEKLPIEIQSLISEHLDNFSLSQLALCSHHWLNIALSPLYSTLQIRIGSLGADRSSALQMRTLYECDRLPLLRHISIIEPSRKYWNTKRVLDQLSLILSGLLLLLRSGHLRSFAWKALSTSNIDINFCQYIPCNVKKLRLDGPIIDPKSRFPCLSELVCPKIDNIKACAWVEWHVQNCPLRLFDLRLVRSDTLEAPFDLNKLLYLISRTDKEGTQRSLSLNGFDLSHCRLSELSDLDQISLEYCIKSDKALQSLLTRNPAFLNGLSLKTSLRDQSVTWLFSQSSVATRLTRLRLKLYGCQDPLPVQRILLFQQSLQQLTIECRSVGADAASVLCYSDQDLAQLTTHCKNLKLLGLPLNLSIASRKFWVSFDCYLEQQYLLWTAWYEPRK